MSENVKKPPGITARLLGKILKRSIRYGAIGDFTEKYADISKNKGKTVADLWYRWQLIQLMPSFLSQIIYWSFTMFRNYIKIALRNIKRYKGYSIINIAGLAIGITCCILILLWVMDECSYDMYHDNAENIYRLVNMETDVINNKQSVVTPIPLAPVIKAEIPEIQFTSRILRAGKMLLSRNDTYFYEDKGIMADPDFFEIFKFPFIRGDRKTALINPRSMVITEEMANKYFGPEDPLGKTLDVNHRSSYTVTGVIENVPRNSHFTFDFVRPFHLYREFGMDFSDWNNVSFYTYLTLKPGSDIKNTAGKIMECEQNHSGELDHFYQLQPLKKIHLNSHYLYDISNHGDIKYVYIFSVIAVLILLIAYINFVNLTTARSANRAKEVGIRKVIGANRKGLLTQFFGESLIYSFLASLTAFILVGFLLPVFNNLTNKQILFEWSNLIIIIPGLIFFTLVSGILAGLYPAVYISSFMPVSAFKGILKSGKKSKYFRRFLVVIQFSLSIILIVSTVIVYKQLQFIKGCDLGYNKDQIITFRTNSNVLSNFDTFKNELLSNTDIEYVSLIDLLPIRPGSGDSGTEWEGKEPGRNLQMQYRAVDYDFLKTFNLEMSEGRFFSPDFNDLRVSGILNETAVKAMGIKDPVGKKFKSAITGEMTIIGIIKDFNFQSLHSEIAPLFMSCNPDRFNRVCVRLKPYNIEESLSYIKNTYKKFSPDYPFEFNFLDRILDSLYRTEQNIGATVRYFTVLAIFISCLGLLGLASFLAEKRTKEIGIRKVLGASTRKILLLLQKEFIFLVLFSSVISFPVSWYIMNNWLNDFAYRTKIEWWIFPASGIAALLIAVITVSYQTLKAAKSKPADTLKYE